MNVVTGQQGHLLHVLDKQSNTKFLVDGGAICSIIPPTPRQRREGPNGTKLSAANGTPIPCYGKVNRSITIGDQSFVFDFIVADIQHHILGADFLAEHYLAPNHRDALLLNLQDLSTLPAQHVQKSNYQPINFIDSDPCYKLLDTFPEILTPSFTIQEPK